MDSQLYTHKCKICSMCKSFKFAPIQLQVQIFVCIYTNFTHMQIGWMDELVFYVPFNSISVILGKWKGEYERLCAMKCCLDSERILPLAGFKPAMWSEVRSANCSASQTLLCKLFHMNAKQHFAYIRKFINYAIQMLIWHCFNVVCFPWL